MDIKKGLILNESQKQLVEEHHNLIYSFLHKYHYDIEEWYDLAAIGLCKAAYYFKENTGNKFTTFAYKIMQMMLYNEIKEKSTSTHIPKENIESYDVILNESGESFLELFPSESNPEEDAIIQTDCDAFIENQKGRKFDFLSAYRDGLSTQEIASKFHCTPSFVTETRKKLRKEFMSQY